MPFLSICRNRPEWGDMKQLAGLARDVNNKKIRNEVARFEIDLSFFFLPTLLPFRMLLQEAEKISALAAPVDRRARPSSGPGTCRTTRTLMMMASNMQRSVV